MLIPIRCVSCNAVIAGKYEIYNKQTTFSTITKIVLPYIKNKFVKIKKNNEIFFIHELSHQLTYKNYLFFWLHQSVQVLEYLQALQL